MKIVFLARYLPQEGSTIHIYTLSKELIKRGHEVHLISSGPNKENSSSINIFNEIVSIGLKHHQVPFPNEPNANRISKLKLLLMYLMATPKALFLLLKLKPDVVHVHYPVTSYIAKIYKIITKKKFITTHHTMDIPKHPLHKKADYVIAISQELREELIGKFDYKEDQVKLIFNGVSREKFDKSVCEENKINIKRELQLPVNVPIIGFVGGLKHGKGIDILLRACSQIDKDFHIVLLGDGNNNWVNNVVDKNHLNANVSIFSFQNPVKFYSIFDIFVLPSRKEGFPLVSIESMMMGVPTIRSNVGGSNDQIDNGVNGFIFENENPDDLSKYLEILLNDPNLRKRIGKNGKQVTLSKFTEEVMMDKLINLYTKTVFNK